MLTSGGLEADKRQMQAPLRGSQQRLTGPYSKCHAACGWQQRRWQIIVVRRWLHCTGRRDCRPRVRCEERQRV